MLTRHTLSLFLLFLVFFIASCSSNKPISSQDQKDNGPLLPMSNEQIFPSSDSGDVKAAMEDYFKRINAPAFSQYDFVRRDLNGDHLKEALIYVTTPYGRWCGVHGCNLVILQAHINGFSLMGSFENIRPPFYISKETSQGWHDIAIEENGNLHKKAKTYILRFNGNNYSRPPKQPYVFSRKLIKASVLP